MLKSELQAELGRVQDELSCVKAQCNTAIVQRDEACAQAEAELRRVRDLKEEIAFLNGYKARQHDLDEKERIMAKEAGQHGN